MTRFFITKKNIDEGVAHNPHRCPTALAILQRLKQIPEKQLTVEVNYDTICIYDTNNRTFDLCLEDTPKKVIKFLHKFDKGKTVDSIQFNLNIPKELLK